MGRRSRRYESSRAVVEQGRFYRLEEAAEALKLMRAAQFDETVECSVQLGIDPRHSDQQIRGTISLPHGTGRTSRVAVFAEGPAAEAAQQAGAEYVGGDELIQKVEGGFTDFDVALAVPEMMSRIGRLGRFLGPRGLMPSPKSGTVRQDIADAVAEFKAGKIEFRNDSGGNVHVPVGKLSFSVEALVENARTLVEQLLRMKPPAAKGRYLRKACLGSTMNPALRIDVSEFTGRG